MMLIASSISYRASRERLRSTQIVSGGTPSPFPITDPTFYQLRPGETTTQYNTRIAQARQTGNLQIDTSQPPVNGGSFTPTYQASDPELKVSGVAAEVQVARDRLTEAYNEQVKIQQENQDAAQKKIDAINKQYEG